MVGSPWVPERRTVKPAYVPARTMTSAPGGTVSAAFCSVSQGAARVPAALSLPVVET